MSGFTFIPSSSSSSSSPFATISSPFSSLSLSNPTSSPTIPFGSQPSFTSSPFGGAAGGFAANSSSAPASISLFGYSSSSSSPASTSLFGSRATPTPASSSAFSGSSLFGASSSPAFSSSTTTNAAVPSAFSASSLFGSSAASSSPAFSSSTAANAAAPPAFSTNLFSSSSSAATTTTSTLSAFSGSSLFGASSSPAFSSSTTTYATAPPAFSASYLFGSSAASSSPAFSSSTAANAAAPPAFSTNLFSSSSSAATTTTSTLSAFSGSSLFGASSSPAFSSSTAANTAAPPAFSTNLFSSSSSAATTTTSTLSAPSFPSTPTITASSAPSFSLGTGLSFSNTTTTSTVSTTATATTPASNLTIVIEEFEGFSRNQVYEASQTYLSTKISPSVARLRVSKAPRDKSFLVAFEKGEMIAESFEGIQLEWRSVSSEIKRSNSADNQGYSTQQSERQAFELSFDNKYKEKVLGSYLPYVLEQANAMKEGDKVVKLYTLNNFYGDDVGVWASINLDHPSTFDTLAMDSDLKVALKNDLDRFLQRKEFYKKVGKAWKRGYLLYGPPGTGKSSLIAAMANYLKFDVYDLELTGVYSDAELRRLLVATAKRSILVIEDIDCKAKLQPREYSKDFETSEKLTLSRLLNFIDGLWSSCGDERIIILTTNHKDRLDPALLRPGRMDMHIHMSYCTPSGFKLLASNYLSIQDHKLFEEIETLIQTVDVTPAEIAEELLKQDDAEAALEGLVQLLLQKRIVKGAVKDESEKEKEQDECQQDDDEQENENKVEKKEIEITRSQWPAMSGMGSGGGGQRIRTRTRMTRTRMR